MSAEELKNEGNELYKQGKVKEAIQAYSKAVALTSKDDNKDLLATLLKNRAAAYLKTVRYLNLFLLSFYFFFSLNFHLTNLSLSLICYGCGCL